MTSYRAIDVYAVARDQLAQLSRQEPGLQGLYDGVCRILNETIPTFSWVGIYLVDGSDLELVAWRGPASTEHVRVPIGVGDCGAAAAGAETIIVPDVDVDPRYLQCFLNTRSEIVVPIMAGVEVLGEIDVDGDQRNAFGAADQEILEVVASVLARAMTALERR